MKNVLRNAYKISVCAALTSACLILLGLFVIFPTYTLIVIIGMCIFGGAISLYNER